MQSITVFLLLHNDFCLWRSFIGGCSFSQLLTLSVEPGPLRLGPSGSQVEAKLCLHFTASKFLEFLQNYQCGRQRENLPLFHPKPAKESAWAKHDCQQRMFKHGTTSDPRVMPILNVGFLIVPHNCKQDLRI